MKKLMKKIAVALTVATMALTATSTVTLANHTDGLLSVRTEPAVHSQLISLSDSQVTNTLYKNDMKISVEHALMDSSKSAVIVPLEKQTKVVKPVTRAFC